MKKLLFFAAIVLLFYSCSPEIYYAVNSYTIDYSKYTEKNFFITESNSVNFEYKPVGSIVVESVSGYYNSEFISANIDDAFIKLYQVAQKNKANGVINVKMNFGYPSKWIVSGMLILK